MSGRSPHASRWAILCALLAGALGACGRTETDQPAAPDRQQAAAPRPANWNADSRKAKPAAAPVPSLEELVGEVKPAEGPAGPEAPPAAAPAGSQPDGPRPVAAPPAGGMRLGLNLAGVRDWSTEWAFVDVFKASRAWILDGQGKLALDKNGNPLPGPGQRAWTLCLRDLHGHYPAGNYVVTWKGSGELGADRFDVAKVVEKADGREVIDVKPADGGIEVSVSASRPDDPIRDIHVWMPGFENARSPFHPLFVERMSPARVVRFMDWGGTNNSELVKWADRPKPGDASYATHDNGVPVEVMVRLANTAKLDPWFCIPHKADDDFVRQFARTVKANLDRDRTAYVEYSNEVWNFAFKQAEWARERGREKKLGDPENGRFYAERAVEVMKIWEEEFGRERLVRVLASQAVVPWLSEQIVSWKDAYKHADALAVAPYFGYEFGDPKTADATARMSPDQLLDALEKEVNGPNREVIRKQAGVARKFGLKLIAYEGGQHLVGYLGAENNEALAKLFQAANRHPRMYDLYRRHLRNWSEAGGDLYVLFNYVTTPSKWGSWGLLEYQDQPTGDAPKYRAFVDAGNGR